MVALCLSQHHSTMLNYYDWKWLMATILWLLPHLQHELGVGEHLPNFMQHIFQRMYDPTKGANEVL